MPCARCGTENREGRRFCAECGAPLALACSACGFANEAGEKFCGGCGAPLLGTRTVAPPKFDSPESYTPRHLAEKILTSKAALEGERKQVTVLFADLKGSMNQVMGDGRRVAEVQAHLRAGGCLRGHRVPLQRRHVLRGPRHALEGNFRLYYYDCGRRQLASTSVKPPALGQWHTVRVVALGDHMQGWLDGTLYLDHRDSRFKAGRVGLWTKADSITAFDDLSIRGVTAAR